MDESKPLEGLKVLELANVLAGPAVGMFFAELGAKVIKAENIKTHGDVTRTWKLPNEDANTDISGYFSCVNWGKYSLAINLEEEEGLKIIYKLVSESDIVLVSYKPGDAEKLKVDYPSLQKYNKTIIYAHVTGYGLKSNRAGFDAIIQAESGFTYMNGNPGSPPTKMPVALMDILAAHHLKEAILLALLHREKTGKGQYIETSLFKAGISSLANQAANWLVGKSIPERLGSDHPNIVPYGTIFKTSDNKEIVVAAGTDKQFGELVTLLGKPELAKNEKFATNQNRVKNKYEIISILQELIAKYTRKEILEHFNQKRIPAGGVFNMEEVFHLPQSKEMMFYGKYADGKQIEGVRSVAFNTPDRLYEDYLSPPPQYGDHTEMILRDIIGFSEDQLQELINKKVIYARKK